MNPPFSHEVCMLFKALIEWCSGKNIYAIVLNSAFDGENMKPYRKLFKNLGMKIMRFHPFKRNKKLRFPVDVFVLLQPGMIDKIV
jgi:hypothetical protein